MSAIGKFVSRIRHRRAAKRALGLGAGPLSVTPATRTSPPVIHGPFGGTTESARLQAAANIAADPAVRRRVLAALAAQLGSEARALAYARVAYPEAGWDGDDDAEETTA